MVRPRPSRLHSPVSRVIALCLVGARVRRFPRRQWPAARELSVDSGAYPPPRVLRVGVRVSAGFACVPFTDQMACSFQYTLNLSMLIGTYRNYATQFHTRCGGCLRAVCCVFVCKPSCVCVCVRV